MAVTFTGRDLVVDFKEDPDSGADAQYRIEFECGTSTITHFIDYASYSSLDGDDRCFVDTLTYEENRAAGLTRTPTVKLYTQNANGTWSEPLEVEAVNPQPTLPSAPFIQPGLNSAVLNITAPTAGDLAGYLVHRGTSSGFTPDAGNLVYDGPGNSVTVPLPDTATYHFKVAPYDSFDKSGVTYSSAVSTAAATALAGLNNALVHVYKRASSSPALPSASTTYTFSTGVLTGLNNGWTQAVPTADGNPLYVSVATASANTTTDTIASGEWSSAVILAQDGSTGSTGAAGLNSATVFLYQRAASAPSVPGTTTTYTFATGVLSGTLGSWTQSVPAGSNPCYIITATAASTSSTDTIATGEWATPQILVQDGATGATGSTGTAGLNNTVVYLFQRSGTGSAPTLPSGSAATYTFATGAVSGGTLNGWTTAIPAADGNPIYVTAQLASSNTSTASLIAAGWSAGVLKDGAGVNHSTVVLYQRTASSSAPSVPGSTLTYTFATGALSGTLGSWTTAAPSMASGAYLHSTFATAVGTGSTDTIATGEWSTPQVLSAQDWATITGANRPADNATVNIITYSSSAPGSPTNGDVWVDTSVTPNLMKVRVSGAWQVSSNYVTNTNQVTDGANLGGTAVWTGVSSRPANVAALSGGETINNASISVASGLLSGIGTGNNTAVGNSLVSISSGGVLSGAGGGTVTISGLDSDILGRIIAMRGDNYLRNGYFNEGQSGYNLAADCAYVATTHTCPYGIKFNSGATLSTAYFYYNQYVSYVEFPFPTLFVSFDVYSTSVVSILFVATTFKADGTAAGAGYVTYTASSGGAGWSTHSSAIALPTGTAKISGYFQRLTTAAHDTVITNMRIGATARRADVTVEQPVVGLLSATTGRALTTLMLGTASIVGIRNTNDVAMTSSDAGSTATINVPTHERRIPGASGVELRTYNSGSITGKSFGTLYFVYTDDATLAGGTVTYVATTNSDDLAGSINRVYIGSITTVNDGGGGGGGGGWGGGGGGGGGVIP